jgi:hypothetical protein
MQGVRALDKDAVNKRKIRSGGAGAPALTGITRHQDSARTQGSDDVSLPVSATCGSEALHDPAGISSKLDAQHGATPTSRPSISHTARATTSVRPSNLKPQLSPQEAADKRYFQQQRATMTVSQVFTWGGRKEPVRAARASAPTQEAVVAAL